MIWLWLKNGAPMDHKKIAQDAHPLKGGPNPTNVYSFLTKTSGVHVQTPRFEIKSWHLNQNPMQRPIDIACRGGVAPRCAAAGLLHFTVDRGHRPMDSGQGMA